MKTSGGFFKDKASVGFNSITGDQVDKALIKTTDSTIEAPNEKYVSRLIDFTKNGYKGKFTKDGKSICRYIISDTRKRIHSHNWVVVLKALILLHRLAIEGPLDFTDTLSDMKVFDYMCIKSLEKSSEGARHKLFITQYTSYLHFRVRITEAAPKGWRLESDEFESSMALVALHAILEAMDSFVSVPFIQDRVDNYICLEAFRLLIIDGKRLYHQSSRSVLNIVQRFHDLSIEMQEKNSVECIRYNRSATALKEYFDTLLASSIPFKESVPSLQPLPGDIPTLLKEIMEEHSSPTALQPSARKPEVDQELDKAVDITAAPPSNEPPPISLDDLFVFSGEPPVVQEDVPQEPPPVEEGWDTGAPPEDDADWGSGAPIEEPADGPVGNSDAGWDSGVPTISPEPTLAAAAVGRPTTTQASAWDSGLPEEVLDTQAVTWSAPITDLAVASGPKIQKKNPEKDLFQTLYESANR